MFFLVAARRALAFQTATVGASSSAALSLLPIDRNARITVRVSIRQERARSGLDSRVPGNSPELAQTISGEITALSDHSSSVGRPVHARLPPAHPFVCLLRLCQ